MSGQLDDVVRGLAALPTHLQPGLRRYVEHGEQPGSFLCAVIENDLLEAVCRAGDGIGFDELLRLARFLYNDCPSGCHGSRAKRSDWQARGGLVGDGRERARD